MLIFISLLPQPQSGSSREEEKKRHNRDNIACYVKDV